MKTKKTQKSEYGRLSSTFKPAGMSTKTWQVALRQEAASKENFDIREKDPKFQPGYFSVRNFQTRSEYKVVFRGLGSKWNFCSCMDFKASGLGTCKHIEAVKNWSHSHRKYYKDVIPPFTSVYLDYTDGRKIKIRIGTDNIEEFEAFSLKYFDKNRVLKKSSFPKIDKISAEAVAINDTFRFYDDAYEYVVKQNDAARRVKMSQRISDTDLDNLLKTRLYPYQREGIRFAFEKGKSIIADEMGLGKTIQAIGTAELLKSMKLVSSVLIVCPTSLKYQWKSEIEKFTDSDASIVEGNQQTRLKIYKDSSFYKIVSYNAASNDIKLCGSLSTDMLIMDEVQRLKNWNTQISRAARKIKSDYSVVLSGTPLENKLEELYSVMQFVDQFCLGPLHEFREQTMVMGHTGKIIAYKNLNAVGAKLRNVMIRRRKTDVALQLPSRTDTNLFVPMTQEQEAQHSEYAFHVNILVNKWNQYHFLSETDRRRLLLLLSQMRMVCDSTFILDQETRFDVKVDEVMNIIKNIVESGDGKIVVFSSWERMTRLVAQDLDNSDISYAYLHGGVPSEQRSHLVRDFTCDPDCRVFLSTDAGSTGLNLQVASTLVNLDLPWNPAVLEQRVARIYRIGQQNPIQVFNLVSKLRAGMSIEERMIGTLGVKSALAEGILDNGQDMISIDDNKLQKLMETLQPMAQETSCEAASDEGDLTEKESPESAQKAEQEQSPEAPETSSAEELLQQGISFLSGLGKALQDPQSSKNLVDALVKTDEKTGQSSINIPIKDKSEVLNVLGVIARLFQN